ncbi:hypothetical protein SUDANB105_05331 [Streptomyces sp. enrichment culture]
MLAQRAPLLLLDEPTAALDLKHQEPVPQLCRERAAAGPPAEVFSDHLLSEVYDQPVEVLPHPRTGAVLVTPRRDG